MGAGDGRVWMLNGEEAIVHVQQKGRFHRSRLRRK